MIEIIAIIIAASCFGALLYCERDAEKKRKTAGKLRQDERERAQRIKQELVLRERREFIERLRADLPALEESARAAANIHSRASRQEKDEAIKTARKYTWATMTLNSAEKDAPLEDLSYMLKYQKFPSIGTHKAD